MPRSPQNADPITGILDALTDAVTAVEGRQDEHDRTAMQLVQLVSVDLQDITDTHEALLHGAFDRAAELDEITAWLAGYHTDHPGLATELTALLETAAAALRDQATR